MVITLFWAVKQDLYSVFCILSHSVRVTVCACSRFVTVDVGVSIREKTLQLLCVCVCVCGSRRTAACTLGVVTGTPLVA